MNIIDKLKQLAARGASFITGSPPENTIFGSGPVTHQQPQQPAPVNHVPSGTPGTFTPVSEFPSEIQSIFNQPPVTTTAATPSRLSPDKTYDMFDPNSEIGQYLINKSKSLADSAVPLKARLLAALIQTESSGNPKATSPRPNDPSWGLGQETPGYLKDTGFLGQNENMPNQDQINQLYDPQTNIDQIIAGLQTKLKNFKYTSDPMVDAPAIYRRYNGTASMNDPRITRFKDIYSKVKSKYGNQ